MYIYLFTIAIIIKSIMASWKEMDTSRRMRWVVCCLFALLDGAALVNVKQETSELEQEYMHEESDHLFTFRTLFETSPLASESYQYTYGHCIYPDFCQLEEALTTSRICSGNGMCHFDQETCSYWCECLYLYTGVKCQTFQGASIPQRGIGPYDVIESSDVTRGPEVKRELVNDSFNETSFGRPDWYEAAYDDVHSSVYELPANGEDFAAGLLDAGGGGSPLDERVNASCAVVEREEGERACPAWFSCLHGVCNVTEETDELHGGPVQQVTCVCDPGWLGDHCELCCDRPCGDHGACDASPDHGLFCRCHWGWSGDACQLAAPMAIVDSRQSSGSLRPAAAGLGALAVLLALLAPALLYAMWRRRVPIVLRLVRLVQPWEEQDGRRYDAFVSYKSTSRDESFVVHHLYPKLELEHGFKLCLHFRDFTPGETIANNIIRAIHDSRRTILVLTPHYIESEWARFEYQVAQHEMLKLRHRIIPIVLDDISDVRGIDDNLQQILKSVTYIRYPGIESSKKEDKFWQKLILSLPKKREDASQSTEDCALGRFTAPPPDGSGPIGGGLNNQTNQQPNVQTNNQTTTSELITSV